MKAKKIYETLLKPKSKEEIAKILKVQYELDDRISILLRKPLTGPTWNRFYRIFNKYDLKLIKNVSQVPYEETPSSFILVSGDSLEVVSFYKKHRGQLSFNKAISDMKSIIIK